GLLGLVVVWPIVETNPMGTMPIVLAALAGVGLAVGCFVAVRCGLVAAAVRVFQHLRTGRLEGSRPSVPATCADETPAYDQPGRAGGAAASTGWHLVGWLVNVAELWLACHFLGLRLSLGVVVAGEALGALGDGVFFFLPMRIGAAEGGRVFLFALLG